MLRVCEEKFTCDKCPICAGIEHRLKYCSDAFEPDEIQSKPDKPRKTGREYRRKENRRHIQKHLDLLTWRWLRGMCQSENEKYVKYSKSSKNQGFWKKYSNKKVRRYKGFVRKGGSYRRLFDYAWEVD